MGCGKENRDRQTATVSVIIPVYNREDLIERAVMSAAVQHRLATEIIVVDDGSTDGTAAVVEALEYPMVRLVRQANKGVSAARNTGIRAAQSNYIVFLDSDDRARPEWLETLLGLAEEEDASIVFSGLEWFDPISGVSTDRLPFSATGAKRGLYLPGAYMVKRSLLEEVGGFDEQLKFSENSELGIRLDGLCKERGLLQSRTSAVLFTMDRALSGDSHPWKLAAVERILTVHDARFRANKRLHSRWLGIAAVESVRHRQNRKAIVYALRSLWRVPDNRRAWLRWGLTMVPPLARIRWVGYADPMPDGFVSDNS